MGGATGIAIYRMLSFLAISIHAPRGGSDVPSMAPQSTSSDFNPRSPWGERRYVTLIVAANCLISIHAPRGGSDNYNLATQSCDTRFQSTLPVGGATIDTSFYTVFEVNFNPRSPWGERQTAFLPLA